MSFKKARVVMLSTANHSLVKCIKELSDVKIGELKITPRVMHSKEYFKEQHLYIVSDDEIKEGDWVYDVELKKICHCNTDLLLSKHVIKHSKKIIATTDKLPTESYQGHFEGKDCTNYLPRPSQAFIEKYVEQYNKVNQITDILVEYEVKTVTKGTSEFDFVEEDVVEVKVNPTDNTITIKKVKDSWSRREVEEITKKAVLDYTGAVFYLIID